MSKYEALWQWVGKQTLDKFKLTYAEIERIAGIPIDHSFLKYKKELKCPNCGTTFTIDEAEYFSLETLWLI